MPVVTITTFQVGVSGVASRSRFTTPTRSGSARIGAAVRRGPSVLPGPVPRHDPESPARGGQVADLLAVLPLEQGVEVQTQRELDGLAGSAGRGDDDDAPLGMSCVAVGVWVGRKMMVAGRAHAESYPRAPLS